MNATLRRCRYVLFACALAAAGCTERQVLEPPSAPEKKPETPPEHTGTRIERVVCEASVAERRVRCGAPEPADGNIIVGGQNTYVTLASSNVAYNAGSGQFTFFVTVTNLIEQPMGTEDGSTQSVGGIRVFFHELPAVTSGTGSVSVVPHGFAFFTSAAQAFYQYDAIIGQGQTTAVQAWTFIMPPTVTTFAFSVYVSAPVQWPDGYVTLDGNLPNTSFGGIHPTSTEQLTAVVKTAVGTVVPGAPVTFSTTDASCATVDNAGLVTPVRAGTCSITADSEGRPGSLSFAVTGMTRTWDGSEGTDWETGDNWALGLVPATVDSVLIPAAAPNYPVLAQATAVGGVTVEDNASLSIGAHELTVAADVETGATAGGGILGTTGWLVLAGNGAVRGRTPLVRVTGTYALDGDVTTIGRLLVAGGRLTNASNQYRVQH
ncbi:MAG TPA: hypothetical protein VK928_13485 [Longimicrobiales bacterium]|nr:hypothetical protein [Longimicrobiales bacterium]